MAAPLVKQVFYTVKINNELFDVTGRKRTPKGYVHLCVKGHPSADMLGYVQEHRVMMEMKIGRFLKPNEIVHLATGWSARGRRGFTILKL